MKHRNSRLRFAWKQVDREKSPFSDVEVQILKRLKHENIIKVYEVFVEGEVMDMMLELCTGDMRRGT